MIGSAVGPYQILDKIGVGGMGEVFLGHDPRLQRRVALKCLAAAPSDAVGDRILREARAAARLNHPHIAAVYDVLEQGDRTFIVMEYVEGESLAARLRRGAPSIDEIQTVGRQLASALAAAHAQGVVHRDLKPANVMIGRDGGIKVLDFGVAKLSTLVAGTESVTGLAAPESTLAGNPGTPVYMSPEQLYDRPVDGRSDLYSAGVILYEMATGRRPYAETGAVALAMAMAKAPPPFPRSIVPSIPMDLDGTIMRALEREPDRRFQTARELEAALATTKPTSIRPPAAGGRRIARWTIATLAVAALLSAGVALREPLARLMRPAAPDRPTVLAILPVDNPTGDSRADYVGAGIASVVVQNFSSVRGLTVLSRAATAPYAARRQDLAAVQRELGAHYVLDPTIRSVAPEFRMMARLRRPNEASPVWEGAIGGDLSSAQQTLVDELARALADHGVLAGISGAEAGRIHRVPTTSGAALMLYCEARALMDRSDVPGNVDRAIDLLNQATVTDPRFALAWAALGDAFSIKYQTTKDVTVAGRADEAIRRALAIDSDQGPVYYSLAMVQQQTGRPDDAIASLRRAIALQPDSDDAHRLLGNILASTGRADEGIAELNSAIRIRPSFWSNYFTLGFILYNAGRYEAAQEAYRRTTELLPTYAPAFTMLGTVEYILGHTDRAIGNYEHAMRLGPTAPAYANLAFAYFGAGRYNEALDTYTQALEKNPRSAVNRRNIGDVYEKLGRTDDARKSYQAAIDLGEDALRVNQRDAAAISIVAICEAKLGRRADAEKHAAEAVALAPANRDVLVRSAQVHARLGDFDAALAELASAIARGYERWLAREDEDLAPLRTLPRFQELTKSDAAPSAARR